MDFATEDDEKAVADKQLVSPENESDPPQSWLTFEGFIRNTWKVIRKTPAVLSKKWFEAEIAVTKSKAIKNLRESESRFNKEAAETEFIKERTRKLRLENSRQESIDNQNLALREALKERFLDAIQRIEIKGGVIDFEIGEITDIEDYLKPRKTADGKSGGDPLLDLIPGSDPSAANHAPFRFVYHHSDDSISCNGRHLTKSMPARILRRLVRDYVQSGRREFEFSTFKRDSEIVTNRKWPNFEARLRRVQEVILGVPCGLILLRPRPGYLEIEASGPIEFAEEF